MYQQDSNQISAAFLDVAAYFSEEEWKLLHEWQKDLYKNVMKEVHQALLSLGPLITTTVLSLRAKENEDPYPVEKHKSERKKSPNLLATGPRVQEVLATHHSSSRSRNVVEEDKRKQRPPTRTQQTREHQQVLAPLLSPPAAEATAVWEKRDQEDTTLFPIPDPAGYTMANPNVLFRINSKEIVQRKNPQDTETGEKHDRVSTEERPPLNTDTGLRQEEPPSILIDDLGMEVVESSTDHNLVASHVVTTSLVPFGIKDEEERYSVDHQISKRTGSIGTPSDNESLCIEWKDGRFGKWNKETQPWKDQPGKENVQEFQSSGSQLWPGSILELQGDESIQHESSFSKPSCSTLHPQNPKLGSSVDYTECDSNPTPVKSLSKQPNMQQKWTRYSCTECTKSFSAKASVIRHHRTHTGERPFRCTQCKKSFIQNGDLIRHWRSHSGERPYRCTECGKSFTQSWHLRGHQRMHGMYVKQEPNLETFS